MRVTELEFRVVDDEPLATRWRVTLAELVLFVELAERLPVELLYERFVDDAAD